MTEPALEPISEAECWVLLTTIPVGRVAVSLQGEAPLVVPVNHRVQERTIVFRSGAGMKLDSMREAPVSFQADGLDLGRKSGWSVLVRGVAVYEGDSETEVVPQPWVGEAEHRTFVRIVPTHVSGRRIIPGALDWEPRGYL